MLRTPLVIQRVRWCQSEHDTVSRSTINASGTLLLSTDTVSYIKVRHTFQIPFEASKE
jgi:hypothetical protein